MAGEEESQIETENGVKYLKQNDTIRALIEAGYLPAERIQLHPDVTTQVELRTDNSPIYSVRNEMDVTQTATNTLAKLHTSITQDKKTRRPSHISVFREVKTPNTHQRVRLVFDDSDTLSPWELAIEEQPINGGSHLDRRRWTLDFTPEGRLHRAYFSQNLDQNEPGEVEARVERRRGEYSLSITRGSESDLRVFSPLVENVSSALTINPKKTFGAIVGTLSAGPSIAQPKTLIAT